MHSLFVRIFVLFWVAMALIVGGSIAITFTVTAGEYGSPFGSPLSRRPAAAHTDAAIEASQVLGAGGLPALKGWLASHKNSFPDRDLFIIGPDGRDILGRRLSEGAVRRLEFFSREGPGPAPDGGPEPPPGNFHAPHYSPQIMGPDGSIYTVLQVPRRPSIFGALSLPQISLTILCIALAVSALASWWLARHLSAPIRRIQEGARTLAAERLDMRAQPLRVSAGLEDRRDEVAVLARDFDAMADQLRANREGITQLLRDISHELRSPLSRMRVAVGLARQPTVDLPRQLDRLEREIERLDGLISQVLKLARLHGANSAMERERFALDEVLEDVVRDANFEAEARGCRVILSGDPRAAVWGNRELLSSAVENVLRNAVRYSPDGSTVEVAVRRPDGAGIAIAVRDRGPGVPEADLERIFEPFYRVAESRDRDTGGEGIGLAITAQVMKAHGGSARAANVAGGGFEVSLVLPGGALPA